MLLGGQEWSLKRPTGSSESEVIGDLGERCFYGVMGAGV